MDFQKVRESALHQARNAVFKEISKLIEKKVKQDSPNIDQAEIERFERELSVDEGLDPVKEATADESMVSMRSVYSSHAQKRIEKS